MTCEDCADRNQIAEQLIKSESRCRLLERTLREMSEHYSGDRSEGSLATALLAQIAGLERNIDKLTSRGKR